VAKNSVRKTADPAGKESGFRGVPVFQSVGSQLLTGEQEDEFVSTLGAAGLREMVLEVFV
jgi:hypothetical protein